MKELILFSLSRRFNNRSTKVFNILVIVFVFAIFFSDKIVLLVNPNFYDKDVVYVKDEDSALVDYLNENSNDQYQFLLIQGNIQEMVKENHLVIERHSQSYTLYSKYELSPIVVASFQTYLDFYKKQEVLLQSSQPELMQAYDEPVELLTDVLQEEQSMSENKANVLFLFVSAVYFMMLSFISSVASEVVNEKSTKTLELVLTSIPTQIHFISKILVGWLVIIIQGCLSGAYMLIAFILRNFIDQGAGLLRLANTLGIYLNEHLTFSQLLQTFDINVTFLIQVVYVLLFLLLGVLLIQVILVVVSSFTSSIEEAGNLQAPFYLFLMVLYYAVISLNTPQQLNEGIGYYLSFVPFLNMLLMPCRIMAMYVPTYEILISLSFSFVVTYIVCKKGMKVYARGVLDYSCKGFLDVVRKIQSNPRK